MQLQWKLTVNDPIYTFYKSEKQLFIATKKHLITFDDPAQPPTDTLAWERIYAIQGGHFISKSSLDLVVADADRLAIQVKAHSALSVDMSGQAMTLDPLDQSIYLGDCQGYVTCLSIYGQVKWRALVEGPIHSLKMVTLNGASYLAVINQGLYLFAQHLQVLYLPRNTLYAVN